MLFLGSGRFSHLLHCPGGAYLSKFKFEGNFLSFSCYHLLFASLEVKMFQTYFWSCQNRAASFASRQRSRWFVDTKHWNWEKIKARTRVNLVGNWETSWGCAGPSSVQNWLARQVNVICFLLGFHWGQLPLSYSSTLKSFSIKVVFHWGHLPFYVVFH